MKVNKDKIKALETVADNLLDLVIHDTDPKNWIANKTPIAEMTQQERGDNFWCKKSAAATVTICMKVHALVDVVKNRLPAGTAEEKAFGLREEIATANKEIDSILSDPKVKSMVDHVKKYGRSS